MPLFCLFKQGVPVSTHRPKTEHADTVRFRSTGKLPPRAQRYSDVHGNLRDVWRKGQEADPFCCERTTVSQIIQIGNCVHIPGSLYSLLNFDQYNYTMTTLTLRSVEFCTANRFCAYPPLGRGRVVASRKKDPQVAANSVCG